MTNVLAGDIGGTTTRLGVFEQTRSRPRALAVREFTTLEFPDLPAMISAFLGSPPGTAIDPASIASACFGVAGPVAGDAADLTNIAWRVDANAVSRALGLSRVRLLNDLVALAYAVPVLLESELHVLQPGRPDPAGPMAVLAAGTGLGAAVLHRMDGRFLAQATESGHADFAARTDRDITVLRDLSRRQGRASVEDVLSGHGLTNIYRAVHASRCAADVDPASPVAPEAISTAALRGACGGCKEVLDLFVEAYGAEAGNFGLRTVATGGVFVGGGIAPKILPAIQDGAFMKAFRAKAPFEAMLAQMPVRVILNSDAGLLGAATFCTWLTERA